MGKQDGFWKNKLYYGDNLKVLREHIADGSVDLVYLDPPFNSNRSYNVLFREKSGEESPAQANAFVDTWTWSRETEDLYREMVTGLVPDKVKDALEAMRKLMGDNDVLAYLVMMTARLVELRRVLNPAGSLYLHCDPTASHYLKILLDAIFGTASFRSEIIWKRTGAHGAAKKFAPVHDVILYYTASSGATWNRIFHRYSEDYLQKKYGNRDERGRYQTVTLMPSGVRNGATGVSWRGIDPTEKGLHWRYPPERLEELDAEGLIYWGKSGGCLPRLKRYLDDGEGVPVQDVWTDIPPINSQAKERIGYPTQKPITLLQRIVEVSSNPGDLVLDPFCGCGTAIDAAQKLKRRWIGIDIATLAVDIIDARLRHIYGEWVTAGYEVRGTPENVAEARALFARSPFEFRRWAVTMVSGEPNGREGSGKGIDGEILIAAGRQGERDRITVYVQGEAIDQSHVRDLLRTVRSQRAAMGILITMWDPAPGMTELARHSGVYEWPVNGQSYPKIQIVTVEDLLKGEGPLIPLTLLPYFHTERRFSVD